MNVRTTIRSSLSLLSQDDKRKYFLAVVAQVSTALLDLVGVLLVGLVTAIAVAQLTGSAIPPQVTQVLDTFGVADANVPSVWVTLAAIAGVLLILRSAINLGLTRVILIFLSHRQASVSAQLQTLLVHGNLEQLQRRSSQATAYALTTGVNYATIVVLGQAAVAISETALLLVLTIGLLAVSPWMTLFTLLYFALIAFTLQRFLSGWARKFGAQSQATEVASIATVQQVAGTFREISVLNRREYFSSEFREQRRQAASAQGGMQFILAVPKYVLEIAMVLGAAALAASQLSTKDAAAAAAVISVFLVAGSRIVPSMLRLQSAFIAVRNAEAQAAPTYALFRELDTSWSSAESHVVSRASETADRHESGLKTTGLIGGFDAAVRLERVTFRYHGAPTDALSDVSLDIPSGTSLAIAGPTGSGKSTLADVIMGLLIPKSGTVLIGGESPAVAMRRWNGLIAYMPQEAAMIDRSIRANIALGLPAREINDDRVWSALERAHLAEFVGSLPMGLDSQVGELGLLLSGGQRQRLGLARALYCEPRLLILDEATSALDAETENAISSALSNLAGSVTLVIIAHRLSTVRHCDQLIYLEHGEVRAAGTFDEVRKASVDFGNQASLLGL